MTVNDWSAAGIIAALALLLTGIGMLSEGLDRLRRRRARRRMTPRSRAVCEALDRMGDEFEGVTWIWLER